jgi:Bacterial Ig-like domain
MVSQANHLRERRSRLRLVGRTISHPIRSTILGAIAAALAMIALVLAASGNSALAASSLNNGNFETGDLSGWSVDKTASGGDARVVARYVYYNNPMCEYDCRIFFLPHEGSHFALLTSAGQPPQVTSISQPFEASNGDKVSGWAFFHTYWNWFDPNIDPSSGGNDDKAQVVIKSDSGTTVAIPFEDRATLIGPSGGTRGWQYWEHTFTGLTGTGKFRIEARLQIPGPSYCWVSVEDGCSVMGLDDVKTYTLGSDTTKPSTSATRSGVPNAAGWIKDNVTVRLNATDEGGSGVDKITYSASGAQTIAQTDVSGSSVEISLNQDGTTTLTYYATDKDGNAEDQKTLTVKIDKTAPTVKQTSPANGATRVSTSAKISATFLEVGSGIDPDTLTTDTFKVVQVTRDRVKGNVFVPVEGTISYDEASKTVTFTPSSPLLAKATYSATIAGYGEPPRVEDKADNVFLEGSSYAWSFSTGGTLCCGM